MKVPGICDPGLPGTEIKSSDKIIEKEKIHSFRVGRTKIESQAYH